MHIMKKHMVDFWHKTYIKHICTFIYFSEHDDFEKDIFHYCASFVFIEAVPQQWNENNARIQWCGVCSVQC